MDGIHHGTHIQEMVDLLHRAAEPDPEWKVASDGRPAPQVTEDVGDLGRGLVKEVNVDGTAALCLGHPLLATALSEAEPETPGLTADGILASTEFHR
jgi:hypothetical protein